MGKQVEVILTDDVAGLGRFGQTKRVKRGYASNYLVPEGMALFLNDQNLNYFKDIKKREEKKREALRAEAQDVLKTINGQKIIFVSKANESGQLYGSITGADIIESLNEAFSLSLSRKQVVVNAAIKTVGDHPVAIDLFDGIEGEVIVSVTLEDTDEDADEQ